MSFAVISAGVSRLPLVFFGVEPQGNADLIERHVHPVANELELSWPWHGGSHAAAPIELLPQEAVRRAASSRSFFWVTASGPPLNCVQHENGSASQ